MGYLSGTKTMLSLAILSALVTSQAALADESGNIEKITVMGEKNRRSMQDTAASVDVTTALKLEQENIQSLYDILNKTPNISQMYGNRGFTTAASAANRVPITRWPLFTWMMCHYPVRSVIPAPATSGT